MVPNHSDDVARHDVEEPEHVDRVSETAGAVAPELSADAATMTLAVLIATAYEAGAAGTGDSVTSRLAERWTTKHYVGGLPFVAAEPLRAAEDLVAAAIGGSGGEHVHLANAYSVALANESPALTTGAFGAEAWILPDSRPVSWISALRGDAHRLHQIRGPQFMLDVCEAGVGPGLRHFLLGGTPEVLARLEAALRARYPGIDIAGSFSPPFRQASEEELVLRDQQIQASGAQVVWVGLGTPKQDREAQRLARSTGLIAIAVGAAFDYGAGALREAPAWVSRIGLEWLFRLLVEPRRLWRRYLIGNTRFIAAALRHGSRPMSAAARSAAP